jgi:ribosomal protein S8E
LDHGNYAWPGEAVTRKARIISVVYNPTNPEYVRTNTIVKGSVVQIDATPFKNWYQKHYGVVVGKAGKFQKKAKKSDEKKSRKHRALKPEKPKKTSEVKAEKDKKKSDKKGADAKKAADAKKSKKAEKPAETKAEEKPVEAKKKVVAKPAKVAEKVVAEKKVVKKVTKKVAPKKDGEVKKERKCKALNNSRPKSAKHRPSGALLKKWRLRNATRVLEAAISEQLEKGRIYAKVATSPGQIGSADGYILEGEELAFYVKKMQAKKKK